MTKKAHPWVEEVIGGSTHVYPIDLAASVVPTPDRPLRPVHSPAAKCVLCQAKLCAQLLVDRAVVHQPADRAALREALKNAKGES